MNEGLFRSPNARAAFPSGGPAPVGAQRSASQPETRGLPESAELGSGPGGVSVCPCAHPLVSLLECDSVRICTDLFNQQTSRRICYPETLGIKDE